MNIDHAECVCDEGFVAKGLSCQPELPTDACNPNPCTTFGRTVCTADGGLVSCACDADRVEVAGECLTRTACIPNPCTAPFQTVCVAQDGVGTCECVPGHVPAPDGNGCDAMPVWSCNANHSGGVEDAFEPDECPPSASDLSPGASAIVHSLAPAGDVDWFRISGEPGHVYRFTAVANTIPLYADAFEEDGITSIAADHRNTSTAKVTFRIGASGIAYVTIRAVRHNDTGNYTVSLEELGVDDFGEDVASAIELLPGSTITGELQYFGDIDVVKVAVIPGHSYSAKLSWTSPAEVVFEALNADGSVRQHRTNPKAEIVTHPSSSAIWLRISASSPVELGGYTLTLTDLGADDLGDVPEEATPIAPGGSSPVTLERTDDADVLSFEAEQGHVYVASCAGAGNAAGLALTLTNVSASTVYASSPGPAIAYEAEATANRYLQIRATASSVVMSQFTCSLVDVGLDDFGDDTTHATSVAPGLSGGGKFEVPNDLDVLAFSATPGHIYEAACTLQNGGSCQVRLLTASGVALATTPNSTLTWECASPGSYFVEFSSSGAVPPGVAYTFSLTDLGPDDYGDTIAAASPITFGAPGSGLLELTNDVDVFSFSATAGHIIQFSATASGFSFFQASLYGPTGASKVGSSYVQSTTLSYKVDVSGTWYASVAEQGYSTPPVSYTFAVQDLGVDDHGDDFNTATTIAPGDSGQGVFEYSGDVDAFAFTPTPGRIYAFKCTVGSASSCPVAIKDQVGNTVITSQHAVYWEAPSANPVVVLVGAYSSLAAKPVGTYGWSLTDVGVDDFGDTTAAATPIVLPSSPSGAALDYYGDVDVFSLSATAGHIYQFNCTRGTSILCQVVAKNSNGTVVASTNSVATTVSAAFKAASTATYTFEVSGGPPSNGVIGSYSWYAEDLGTDDHGDTLATGTPVTFGASTSGAIQYKGDVDAFSFTATSGRFYKSTCSPGTLTSCSLWVRTPAGSFVVTGTNSASFKAPASSTYDVEVMGLGQAVGTYSIVVDDLGPDDHADTYSGATPLTAGFPTVGEIEIPSDVDYFSLALSAGASHTVTLSPSSTFDISVYSTNGVTLIASGASPLAFTPTQTGTYYFRVSTWASAYGPSYTITVQ